MRALAVACIVLVCLPLGRVAADESVPLSYARTQIAVTRQAPLQLPWLPASAGTAPLTLDTEVREGPTLYVQKGWFSLSGPSEQSAVMLVFSTPVMAPVTPSSQYAPLDILFVSKEGKIIQILPNLLLTDLEEDIYPPEPILALLFLKGGACEKFSIQPGDHVEHARFKKPPVVLNAPAPVSPPSMSAPAAPPSPAAPSAPPGL